MLDYFLKEYDFSEVHKKEISTSPDLAFDVLQQLDLSKSRLIRVLLRLRGLDPTKKMEELFTPLLSIPPHEVIWGLVARPWRLKGDVTKVEPDRFNVFKEKGFAKIVWGFTFVKTSNGTLVTTETRIHCTDSSSRWKFAVYWFFVRPFSGLLRKGILALLERECLKKDSSV